MTKLTVRDRKRTGSEISDIHQCYGIAGYKELPPGGKAIYRQRCQELIESKLLWWVDLPQLIRYAQYMVEYLEMSEKIRAEGATLKYVDKMGNTRVYENPSVKIRDGYHGILSEIERQYGFTPLARKKLVSDDAGSKSQIQVFLSQFNQYGNGVDEQ